MNELTCDQLAIDSCHDKSPAASEATATTSSERAVNPLWIITASLAVFPVQRLLSPWVEKCGLLILATEVRYG